MDSEFWLNGWREGRTAFHRDAPMPLLTKHWPSLSLAPDTRVFVPLAGKSLDMIWLAAQGFSVLGVELSPLAVEQFFADNGLTPTRQPSASGDRFVAGKIEIIQANVFDVDAATLATCAAVYDRAALIAQSAAQRQRYVSNVYARLPPDCRGLVITLDYPPDDMQGPPFAVSEDEMYRLYDHDWHVTQAESRDILANEPGLASRGVTALSTAVYQLQRR